MSAIILDGKTTAKKWVQSIADRVERFRFPSIKIIMVGEDPASEVYVRNKVKDCAECKFAHEVIRFNESDDYKDVIALIKKLNRDTTTTAIMVQLPLPKSWSTHTSEILNTINPLKDVDCLTAVNLGKITMGHCNIMDHPYTPCTVNGIIALLNEYNINKFSGKNVCIIGRSNIVGKPMALVAMENNATVTICHSYTKDIKKYTIDADYLINCANKLNMVTEDMVKENAIVIDVSTIRGEDGKLHGGVDFDKVKEVASYITPVPGGIGPMTRAALMENISMSAIYSVSAI